MATSLDLPPRGDATAQASVPAQIMRAGQEEARRKAAEEARREAENARQEAQLKLNQNADARATESTRLSNQKSQNELRSQLAAADAAEWTQNPQYQVPWAKAPEEARRHFSIDTYGEAAPSARVAWDASLRQQGIPVETPGPNEDITINPQGEATRRISAPQVSTAGQITAKDVANEGIDPTTIPQSEWPAAVANARKAREGKMTEGQSSAAQYSARMAYQRGILDRLEANGYDPATAKNAASGMRWVPNRVKSGDQQAYSAARDNWIAAVLRKESGAAISPSEYDNAYRQYFPQWGDAPEVIKQKSDLRRITEDNMRMVAGGRAAEAETAVPTTPTAPTQRQLSSEDQAALNWANANPNDPRAARIKALHGAK